MLRSGNTDATRTQRALEAIFNNATRQGRLIEELLDVSRIVAGRAVLDLQDVDLGENIRGAVESMMPIAASKGIEIRFDPIENVRVVADPRRLEQVFLNLLSNAVKFTPANGRVVIDVVPEGSEMDVRVADTGIGIDPAFLPYVFDRFRQGNSKTTRTVGGLGLGLFIARHLVEAQEGSIRAESAGVDQGATFTVRLKGAPGGDARAVALAATALAPVEPTPENSALAGIRVLLVDDEEDSREMMASALETCGATVVSAASAQEALGALHRSHVDVMDVGVGGQRLEAAVRARNAERFRLAARRCLAARGHSHHVHETKPPDGINMMPADETRADEAHSDSLHLFARLCQRASRVRIALLHFVDRRTPAAVLILDVGANRPLFLFQQL